MRAVSLPSSFNTENRSGAMSSLAAARRYDKAFPRHVSLLLKSLSAHWGERVPGATRWAGEVGTLERLWNPPPHLTSPPPGAERDCNGDYPFVATINMRRNGNSVLPSARRG